MNIEKGVPIPSKQDAQKKPERYPFSLMALHDSFVVENHTQKQANHIHTYARRSGITVTTRKLSDTTWRVWRIA